jgi:hypothetical protein
LQQPQPLHLHGFGQAHSGEQRQPFCASAEQAQAERLHFLQEQAVVSFMTSSLFLERVERSPC